MESNGTSGSSGGGIITVFLYTSEKKFECTGTQQTAEDLCLTLAKSLGFKPISIHLFALRFQSRARNSGGQGQLWLPPCYTFTCNQSYHLDFRLRFKLPSLTSLSRLDESAFDYLFHQMRADFLRGSIPEICTEEMKREALGLSITDMLRVIQEKGETRENIENNYKQFIPKPIYKQHMFFLKKKVHESLSRLLQGQHRSPNAKFIKEQYVSQVEVIATSYLTEEFHAVTLREEEFPATIRVDPFHPIYSGVAMASIGKNNWQHLCTIEDLCFISLRGDNQIEISRKNGIPISLKFKGMEVAQSFVSLLDGHYRLTEKWTFNLCKELFTPSLIKLKGIKCHGPIGEKFSYQKLKGHPNTKKGTFILRQSSTNLDEFAIDYIGENKNQPLTKEVRCSPERLVSLAESPQITYATIAELLSFFISAGDPEFYLKECLPPSEYDMSPLLLCRSKEGMRDAGNGRRALAAAVDLSLSSQPSVTLTSAAPQVISARSLQVFRGRKYEFSGNTCKVVKAVWKQNLASAHPVAIKVLKKENEDKYLKEFLAIADQCVLWQCESLVALRGVVLGNPQALVLDWMPFGPLDAFLQQHYLHVEPTELIEAASHIAKALWFLEDHGIVHGNIRCHNVLVADHNDNGLLVKLGDPSIVENLQFDVHWIPPEFYEKPALVKSFRTADIWAAGTTLWEIFSYGASPPRDHQPVIYKSKYQNGWRLPRPDKCPMEIHRIISECWSQSPVTRKQPQALVRDIHQILYILIGSKRKHSYETVSACSSEGNLSKDNNGFDTSDNFNWTTFGSDGGNVQGNLNLSGDGTVSTFVQDTSSTHSGATQMTWLFQNGASPSPDLLSSYGNGFYNGSIGTVYSGMSSARGIYEFEKNQITLGILIGAGCYGEVYIADLQRTDGSSEQVAVKKLKENENISEKEELDFRREFDILKNLSHPNIVEVKGVVYDPSLMLVMEYFPLKSLKNYFGMSYAKLGLRQLIKFAQDVADGMEYLSQNNIVHRDLASRNLLLANEDLVKISDFGLARFTDNDNCYTIKTDRKIPFKWYPPECLEECKFSESSDVWSYGVTLHEIFSFGVEDEPNLPGMSETSGTDDLQVMLDLLKKGVRLACPPKCPHIVYTHLMLPCWQLDPVRRPLFRKLAADVHEVESQLPIEQFF